MTSDERREARYQRRKAERELRKEERNAECGTYNDVFSFENLYKAYKQSCKGVLWKSSVQTYKANALMNVVKTRQQLVSRSYKSRGFVEFDLIERGKLRHIKSVHISERVVQRCLCDNCLVPLLKATFIYDNGASLKNKGIDFSLNRLTRHLREYFHEYGNDGYILLYDFTDYFNSAQHEPIFRQYERCITDGELIEQARYFIRQFGAVGMGLGSQVSQISAIALPNPLDHRIKEVADVKQYGRYMDDGYIIRRDKEELKAIRAFIIETCASLGITMNPKKTQIVKLSHGFTFLKARFALTDTGKVICGINPKSVRRMRRKLRTFRHWVDTGKMALCDAQTSYKAWRGSLKRYNSRKTLKKLRDTDEYYQSLFGGGVEIVSNN